MNCNPQKSFGGPNLNPLGGFGGPNLGPSVGSRPVWGIQFGGNGNDYPDEIKEAFGNLYLSGRSTSASLFGVSNPRGYGVACAFIAVFNSTTLRLKNFVWISGGFTGTVFTHHTSFVVEESGAVIFYQVGAAGYWNSALYPMKYAIERIDPLTGVTINSASGDWLSYTPAGEAISPNSYYGGCRVFRMFQAGAYYFYISASGANAAYRFNVARYTLDLVTKESSAIPQPSNLSVLGGYPEKSAVTQLARFYGIYGDGTDKKIGNYTYNSISAWGESHTSSDLGSPVCRFEYPIIPYDKTSIIRFYKENSNTKKWGVCTVTKTTAWSLAKQTLLGTDSVNDDTILGGTAPILGRCLVDGRWLFPMRSKNSMFGVNGKATRSGIILCLKVSGTSFVVDHFKKIESLVGEDVPICISGPQYNIEEYESVISPLLKNYYHVAGYTAGSIYADNAGGNDVFISRQTI